MAKGWEPVNLHRLLLKRQAEGRPVTAGLIGAGQSGNFLSPHYADLLRRWRDGDYIRIGGSHDEISSSAAGTLLLLPAAQR